MIYDKYDLNNVSPEFRKYVQMRLAEYVYNLKAWRKYDFINDRRIDHVKLEEEIAHFQDALDYCNKLIRIDDYSEAINLGTVEVAAS